MKEKEKISNYANIFVRFLNIHLCDDDIDCSSRKIKSNFT